MFILLVSRYLFSVTCFLLLVSVIFINCKLFLHIGMLLHSPSRPITSTEIPCTSSLFNSNTENNSNITQLSQPTNQSTNSPTVSTMSVPSSNIEISAASLKLPQFWTSCPTAWFIHAEIQFSTRGITQDKTKYEYVVTALPQEVILTILDIIQNPPSGDRYDHLKTTLIERNSISENRKLDQILSDSEMGDRRPSEFYRSMALLAGSNFTPEILKKLWLRKLPKSLNVALTGSNLSDTNELMLLADNLWEVLYSSEVASVREPSLTKSVVSSNLEKIVENLVQATTNICQNFQTLSLDISSIRKQMEEHPYRSQFRRFSRSRSHSRNRSDNKKWLCRFHYKYGSEAKRCEQPCSFSRQNEQFLN